MRELIDAVRRMCDNYDNGCAPRQSEFDELRELCDTAVNELR